MGAGNGYSSALGREGQMGGDPQALGCGLPVYLDNAAHQLKPHGALGSWQWFLQQVEKEFLNFGSLCGVGVSEAGRGK